MTAASLEPDTRLRGVPLVQVAAVHAALAEGFPLEEVLAVEALPRAAWFEAEVTWKARLLSDAAALERYDALLAGEQDRLGRQVKPLETELEAWIHFLRSYQDSRDPFDLLLALGLGLNDMARLGRRWARRFETDDKLAKRAAQLSLKLEGRAHKGDPARLPVLTVKPSVLTPSSAAGTFEVPELHAPPEEPGPGSAPVFGLDEYAALSAALRLAKEQERSAVLARYGIDARGAISLDAAWRARLESDAELFADFRVLVRHYEHTATRRRRAAAAPPTPTRARTAPPPAPSSHAIARFLAPLPISAPPESVPLPPAGTAPGLVMAHVNVLPFQGSVRSLPPIAERLPPRPPAREGDVDATTDVIPALLDSEVLPFEPQRGAPADDVDGTMMLGAISFDDADPLPFSGSSRRPPESDVTVLPGSMRVPRLDDGAASEDASRSWSTSDGAPSFASGLGLGASAQLVITLGEGDVLTLDTTADFVALEVDDPLPFSVDTPRLGPSQPAPRSPPPPRAAPPAPPSNPLDETTMMPALVVDEDDLDSTTLFGAVALELGEDEEPPSRDVASSSNHGLSLDQLASLHAELSVAPEDAEVIRARYRLPDAAAQARWEAYWGARFRAAPREHADYAQKVTAFRAWLLSQRR